VQIGLVLILLLLIGQCSDPPPTAEPGAAEWPGTATYSVPLAALDDALKCSGDRPSPDGSGRSEPVLLVHGTAVTREQNWGWGYWPALQAAGFEVCWVQLPNRALGDIQVSAEYVARAIEVMAAGAGAKVDIIGHSQGGLVPRWAIKYFPSGVHVDDYIGFASPNHGSAVANRQASRGDECPAACWQMSRGSDFVAALNEGDETPGGVSYTSIYTSADTLVTPVTTARLDGASNVMLQEICPGRPVEHLLMAGDAVTWTVALDALTNDGPADPKRIPGTTCLKLALPGATLDWPADPGAASARPLAAEPALKHYARRAHTAP